MPIAARDAFTVPADEGFVASHYRLVRGVDRFGHGYRLPTAGLALDIRLLGSLAGIAIRSAAEVPLSPPFFFFFF